MGGAAGAVGHAGEHQEVAQAQRQARGTEAEATHRRQARTTAKNGTYHRSGCVDGGAERVDAAVCFIRVKFFGAAPAAPTPSARRPLRCCASRAPVVVARTTA